jgi:hypothetical protein
MAKKELGQMLLEAGRITPAQLDEAVQNQVIFGGRLGTNLLELGYIDEHSLSKFLAKQHGVPTVDWNSLNYIRPGLFKLFPKKLAQKYEALPVKLESNKLYVVMANPGHVGTISEMSFATGKAIKPLVLPEVRIFELLNRFYGIGRELRYINVAMIAKPRPKEDKKPKTPVAKIAPARAKEEEVLKEKIKSGAGQDLISEEDFTQLTEERYLQKEMAPARVIKEEEIPPARIEKAPERPGPRPGPQPFREVAQAVYSVLVKHGIDQYLPKSTVQEFLKRFVSDQLRDRVFPLRHLANYLLTEANVQINWLELVLGEIQKLESQLDVIVLLPGEKPPAPAEVTEELEEEEEVFELEEVKAEEEIEELERIEVVEEVEEAVEEERPIEELTLKQAQDKLLTEVDDRSDISLIVLGFARSYFKRSALFTVRGNKVFGWDGLGGILNQKLVESIMLSLEDASVFKTVYDTACHYLGPVLNLPENEQFLKRLGGERPNNVFLIPIVVNGKVVYMLYGDNGEGQNVPFDIGELLILAQKIPQSINELIRRKRASYEARQE